MGNQELLALDPSLNSIGVALFRGSQLTDVGRVQCPSCLGKSRKVSDCLVCSLNPAARCLRMAQEVIRWAIGHESRPAVLAVEWPQVYRGKEAKPAASQIPLAGVDCAVAGILSYALASSDQTLEVRSYLPAEWTGGIPKSRTKVMSSPRAHRISSRLTEKEMHLWDGISHDEMDAIGIGLFSLGRLAPRRRMSGAV